MVGGRIRDQLLSVAVSASAPLLFGPRAKAIHQFNVIISTAFMYSAESDDSPSGWARVCERANFRLIAALIWPSIIHFEDRVSTTRANTLFLPTDHLLRRLWNSPPEKFIDRCWVVEFQWYCFSTACTPGVIKELLAFVGRKLIQPLLNGMTLLFSGNFLHIFSSVYYTHNSFPKKIRLFLRMPSKNEPQSTGQ